MQNTQKHKNYWQKRKIDWRMAYFTPEHPHRDLIIAALRPMRFATVYEMGCGAGANLYRVIQAFPRARVGGVDINADAIEEAKRQLPGNALLEARSSEDVFMNDKSVCVLLSDMHLIYYDRRRIHTVLKEIRRITRNYVIFVEFHSQSWWKRALLWLKTGYFAHNYPRLLTKYGFYDIDLIKLTERDWPGGQPQKSFAYLIIAKI